MKYFKSSRLRKIGGIAEPKATTKSIPTFRSGQGLAKASHRYEKADIGSENPGRNQTISSQSKTKDVSGEAQSPAVTPQPNDNQRQHLPLATHQDHKGWRSPHKKLAMVDFDQRLLSDHSADDGFGQLFKPGVSLATVITCLGPIARDITHHSSVRSELKRLFTEMETDTRQCRAQKLLDHIDKHAGNQEFMSNIKEAFRHPDFREIHYLLRPRAEEPQASGDGKASVY